MEIARRGFVGLLAGTILGRIVGPKLLASTDDSWMPSQILQKPPHCKSFGAEESYSSLEVLGRECLRVMKEELKWLRIEHQVVELDRHSSFPTVYLRSPQAPPFSLYCEAPSLDQLRMSAKMLRVEITIPVRVRIPGEVWADRWSIGQVRDSVIFPTASRLAETAISAIRSHGGGDYMVCGKYEPILDVERSITASSDDGFALSIAQQWNPENGLPDTYIDVRFGIV